MIFVSILIAVKSHVDGTKTHSKIKDKIKSLELRIKDMKEQETVSEDRKKLEEVLKSTREKKFSIVNYEYNILMVDTKDRLSFALTALMLCVGIMLYYYALQLIENRLQTMLLLTVVGGVGPAVFNFRTRYFMYKGDG